jgi:hypothetical protein
VNGRQALGPRPGGAFAPHHLLANYPSDLGFASGHVADGLEPAGGHQDNGSQLLLRLASHGDSCIALFAT